MNILKKGILLLVAFSFVMVGIQAAFISAANTASAAGGIADFGGKAGWVGGGVGTGGIGSSNGGGGGGGNKGGALQAPSGSSAKKFAKPSIPCSTAWAINVVIDDAVNDKGPTKFGWKKKKSCSPAKKVSVSFSKSAGSCPAITKHGIKIKAKGQLVTKTRKILWGKTTDGKYYFRYRNPTVIKNCVYPNVAATKVVKKCATYSKIDINRLGNSRGGAKKIGVAPGSKRIATVKGIEKNSDKCVKSASIEGNASIPTTAANWGQYKLSGKIKFTKCDMTQTKFDGKVEKVWKCGPEKTGAAVTKHMTLWCGGVSKSLINKKWTVNDCIGSGAGGSIPKCSVPKPNYEKKTGTVQTIRDGKQRNLNWGSPKVNNKIKGVHNWRQKINLKGGSTPNKNNKGQALYTTNMKIGGWVGKGSNTQKLGFYAASNPGGGFTLTRDLRFDGKFLVKVGEFKSYNPTTGAIKLGSKNIWVADKNIKCPSATSPKVQPIRTIGDAQ